MPMYVDTVRCAVEGKGRLEVGSDDNEGVLGADLLDEICP